MRLVAAFSPRIRRQIFAALIIGIGLSLIVWSGLMAWQHPCRTRESTLITVPFCQSLFEFLVPLFVALGFWAIGVTLWLAQQKMVVLAFLVMVADILAVGMLAGTGMATDEVARVFYILLAWAVPLTFHFHHSALDRPPRRLGLAAIAILYLLAAASSLPFLFWTIAALEEWGWFLFLRTGIRLGVVVAFGLGWLLLWREYRRGASLAVRSRIRLITFGTLLAFAPLILLSLLPDTFGIEIRLPYELTFPWLLLSPLAYAYSVFRHRLTGAEVALNRAAVYYLLFTLLLSIFLVAAVVLNQIVASPTSHSPWISAMLSVGLVFLFTPLWRGLQWFVNWVLYGGEITYAGVVSRMAESLAVTLDRETLCHLLIEELPAAMHLSQCALFLREKNDQGHLADDLTLFATTGSTLRLRSGQALKDEEVSRLPGSGNLATWLRQVSEPVPELQVRRVLAKVSLNAEEQALARQAEWSFWLPLVSSDVLQGLLLIGRKADDEYFTAEDKGILATVAHQSATAIHNLRLMEEVRAGRHELAHAHQKLLAVRERESVRLAHELHDGAVQQLLGISFQLASGARGDNGSSPAVRGMNQEARRQVLTVVSQLRGLITELRPPGLKELGLVTALEGYVARLRQEGNPEMPRVGLDLDPSGAWLPEPVAVCIFRVVQEALRNALKHAHAHTLWVSLHVQGERVELTIEDDGCGFHAPARLSELAGRGHYGLVSMSERVSWLGGQFELESQPGEGTLIHVEIPLNEAEENERKD
jgi:signal transduction histidine kinase